MENLVVAVPRTIIAVLGFLMLAGSSSAADFKLQLRSQKAIVPGRDKFEVTIQDETWGAKETSVIVCDVWDYHHCLNAVRRMEEFVPRMNELLKAARQHGAIVIHSPSDCMPAYEQHPARQRAIAAPAAKNKPHDIEFWCSRIPSEKSAIYPIDQADGGEDDDPAEHADWAAKLQLLGRNPGMPWKTQSPLVEIDTEHDFISDRGLEVWNILESRGIKNVILVGVHTNMCVLGRPFGLRQMVRNGKHVVLVRDMTDCMYNPKRWPYVNHFTGNDLIVSHTERFVCPTITSDQILGGKPFRSKFDKREVTDVRDVTPVTKLDLDAIKKDWSLVSLPSDWKTATRGLIENYSGVAWFRCSVRIPAEGLGEKLKRLSLTAARETGQQTYWLNGHKMSEATGTSNSAEFQIDRQWVAADDINLLVVRIDFRPGNPGFNAVPTLHLTGKEFVLQGQWQFRLGDNSSWSNIPLPAKFGVSPDILFEP
ncbi:MAG: hypothetical protein JWM11_2879 [Planctomycetaceae bacterium]|nr:hypothetical protein [Planctomycetaceae bacterium]